MKEIANWINGDQDYDEGCALYMQHGTDSAVKSLLKLGKSSFTEKKLLQGLTALVPQALEPKTVQKDFPDQIRKLMNERQLCHNNLFHTPSLSDRKMLAFRILSIGKKLDKYFNNQELPKDEQPPDPDTLIPASAWEMHQLFNNNRSYITKNKKAVDKKGEIATRSQQNNTIEARLKEMTYGAI